jgi:DNA modification methylase
MSVNLILGDCLEEMRKMPDQSIDLILTDPPYNAGIDYGVYKDSKSEQEYIDWINKFVSEFQRVAKASVIFTGTGNLFLYPKPIMTVIWLKLNGMGRSGYVIHNCFEPIVCYGKLKAIFRDIYDFSVVLQKDYIDHPTPKPPKLFKKLINDFSKKGDTVLDPFMGSGTTGVAAKELDRNFIGIDVNPAYIELSKNRIDKSVGGNSLIDLIKVNSEEDKK